MPHIVDAAQNSEAPTVFPVTLKRVRSLVEESQIQQTRVEKIVIPFAMK